MKSKQLKKDPTAWRFVWERDGRSFSSLSLKTIDAYAKGAWEHHGDNCGYIEPVYEDNPNISEGKA